ncbi:MAG: peptidase M56, partial [Oscillospiraceae bacterium]|nr:peptidase M56 [Oscillospiraceae bacterium]
MNELTWIVSSCVLILAVVLLRAVFGKNLSPLLRCALWAVVLARLLYPGTLFTAPVSVQSVAANTEVVQDFSALRSVDSIEHTANGAVEGFERGALMPDRPVTVAHDVTPERFERMQATVRARGVLEVVWLAGAAVTAGVFLLANLRLLFRLRRERRPLHVDAPVRVYAVAALSSSCLFGNAIYVDAATAADETKLRHVLAHELSHRRHGDAVWAFLRMAALVLHWYDPLVWLAAHLARQDLELLADAGALKSLGDGEREKYGETLIDLSTGHGGRFSPLTAATAMGSGKRALRERVSLIAHRRRAAAAVVIAVV